MKQKPEKIVKEDGTIEYRLNGKRHRENGPAIEYTDGSKEWWIDGKKHRVDGPAVEYADGGKKYYLLRKKYDKIKVFKAAASMLQYIQQK